MYRAWNSVNGFNPLCKGESFRPTAEESRKSPCFAYICQLCLVYINTLMMQQYFGEPAWHERMQAEDFRGLTPLVYSHVTPYELFSLI